jgi:hypothetical protein
MSSGAQAAGKDDRIVLGDVFIEPDVSLSIVQERRASLTAEERAIAHIPAVVLDGVEGMEHRGVPSLPAAQLFKP